MRHNTKEIISEPRTVPRCFSLYHLDHGHNSSNTSCDPWPPGQLGAGRLFYRRVCICVAHGKHCRLFSGRGDISLVAIYFQKCGGPSQVSVFCTPTAVGTSAGSPLLSLTSPPRQRFCAEDLLKPCWSTLRIGQSSICY